MDAAHNKRTGDRERGIWGEGLVMGLYTVRKFIEIIPLFYFCFLHARINRNTFTVDRCKFGLIKKKKNVSIFIKSAVLICGHSAPHTHTVHMAPEGDTTASHTSHIRHLTHCPYGTRG